MRILHIAYQQLRRYGKTRVSWAQKLTFGLIKNDHYVQGFSDRDVAAFEAPLGIRELGTKKANVRLLDTVDAFEPDLVIAGHCDMITNATLSAIDYQPVLFDTFCAHVLQEERQLLRSFLLLKNIISSKLNFH